MKTLGSGPWKPSSATASSDPLGTSGTSKIIYADKVRDPPRTGSTSPYTGWAAAPGNQRQAEDRRALPVHCFGGRGLTVPVPMRSKRGAQCRQHPQTLLDRADAIRPGA
ncbi:hypothetical protein ACG83_06240 [Frankia sp. R43]|nr:hypothetical protein ACG83_06240 [Frankia sp. R43]